MSERATRRLSQGPWEPRGALFLLASLAGFACGVFPELFLPPHRAGLPYTLPVLKTMLVAEVVIVMMFFPLFTPSARSADKGQVGRQAIGQGLIFTVGKYIVYLAVVLPLYVVASALADATMTDVIRSLLYLTAVASFAWAMECWARNGKGMMTIVLFISVLIVVALPVIYYFFIEFSIQGVAPTWLALISPVNHALVVAQSRVRSWYPSPVWAWLIWPAGAIVAMLALLSFGPRGHHEGNVSCP